MKQFDREISNVQNPAIGAAILWSLVYGYYKRDYKSVPFPLLFVVLPIVFREDLCIVINSTQQASGFSKVSEKLFKGFSNDRLLSVNNAALSMRELTLQSFNIGMAANLYSMDFDTAYVFPLRQTNRSGLSIPTKRLLSVSEKMGGWCAELSLLEICNLLKVRF